ncbi:MAG: IPT/TIG domain-containing protein, partial [Acidimicrobiales bacterium]
EIPLPAANASGHGPATDPTVVEDGVACALTTFCVAVGSYADSGGASQTDGLIDTLSSGSWTATAAPEPGTNTAGVGPGTDADGHQVASLSAVACPADGTCFAVGQYQDSNGENYGLIDSLANGAWSASAAPEPSTNGFGTAPGTDASGKQAANLEAISCPTATSCTAVGTYEDADGNTFGLVETYASGTWSAVAAPEPSSDPVAAAAANSTSGAGSANLTAVDCPSTTSCVAVGTYTDADTNTLALAEQLSNGAWVPTAVTEPATNPLGTGPGYTTTGGGRATFNAVACPVAGTCVAVGNYNDTNHVRYGLIDSLANSAWSASAAPEPSTNASGVGAGTDTDTHGLANLLSVSCATTTDCVAVGGYDDANGIAYGLIDSGSGSSFAASAAPEPAGAASDANAFAASELESVACPSVAACSAVGYFTDSTAPGFRFALADNLIGTTWSSTIAPQPANAGTDAETEQHADASDVTCTTDGGCSMVGTYKDSSGETDGLVDVYLPSVPVVSRISPRIGELARTETIAGSGFFPGSEVYFGRVRATSVTYISPTLVRAVTPAFHLSVQISVTNAGGSSAAGSFSQFTYASPVHVAGSGNTVGLSGVLFTWHCDKFAACHVRAWLQVVVRSRTTGHVSRGNIALRKMAIPAGKTRRIQLLLTSYGRAIVRDFSGYRFVSAHVLVVTPGNVHALSKVSIRKG